ncbi:MAG: hypothetical protein AAGF12_33220 [Myxococcota bacterium]
MTRSVPLALLFVLFGCNVTDTGNPPAAPPTVVPEQVTGMSLLGGSIVLQASPGAVDPGNGTARLFNLDNMAAPTDAPVNDDGSFSAELLAELTDTVRLQIIDGDLRSEPVDARNEFRDIVPAEPACLELPAWITVEVDGTGEAVIPVVNRCSEAIVWGAVFPRRDSGPVEISAPMPEPLPPSATTELRITITSGAATDAVLFLSTVSPVAARRAITIAVTAP